jgi:hypothetical protein
VKKRQKAQLPKGTITRRKANINMSLRLHDARPTWCAPFRLDFGPNIELARSPDGADSYGKL